MKKPKNDLAAMDVDDFLNNFDAELDVSEPEVSMKKAKKLKKKILNGSTVEKKKKNKLAPPSPEPEEEAPVLLKKKKKPTEKPPKKVKKLKKAPVEQESVDEAFEEEGSDDSELDEKSHKEALKKLKNTDPELYSFLEQNDKKLLKFGAEMDDASDSEEEKEEEDETPELQVASDESDFEPDDEEKEIGENVITLKLLKQWQGELSIEKPKLDTLRAVTSAFNSALLSITGDSTKPGAYVVEGSAIFNGVLQLCILHFQGALKKFLGVDVSTRNIQKCKKFKKVSNMLRTYLLDISHLLASVTSSNILTVLLKHLHQMAAVLQAYSSITKPILKRLISLWSSGEETTRILAFLCILRITRQQQPAFLNNVLKFMYLSYVKNSRFVSPSTLPNINFMRRSLTEMFALDLTTSYQHAFLYIRQLAIHLRNAVTLKKKESFQAVYNWQFINSMQLWVDVLAVTHGKPQLQPLIYPLVSIICGVIKLIPTVAYFPLRFHCCKMLAELSRETNTFIPILPFVLEVLDAQKFNEKHKKLSMKPMKFTSILRVSQSQLEENAFRDEVIENVYGLTLQILAQESASVAFPDLAIMPIIALKAYMKKSKHVNYNRKFKQLVEKIQENVQFVETERRLLTCSLKDYHVIAGWEAQLRNKGTPLLKAFEDYAKKSAKKKRREAADTDTINVSDLPTINKQVGANKRKADGPVVLFPDSSGDENGSDEEELEVPVAKKPKKEKKQKQKKVKKAKQEEKEEDEPVDIVEDLNLDDW